MNNFASGLILLFERPIHLGDVVQIAGVGGEVRHIGVRATRGAHRRRRRGLRPQLPAHRPDRHQLDLLGHAAAHRAAGAGGLRGHAPAGDRAADRDRRAATRRRAAQPAAAAVFMGFGENSLDFELRAWTDRFGDAETIQSELADAVYAALREARIDLPVPAARRAAASRPGRGRRRARRGRRARRRAPGRARKGVAMTVSPLAGKPAPTSMLIDLAQLEREYYERRPDVADPTQLVAFGTSGHRGTPLRRHLQRGAHPRHHPGHLRVPRGAGHRRAALHGQGHARAVRPGAAHRARGAGGQRRRDRHPARRRRHADAGDLARHPRLQPRPHGRAWPTASSSRRRTTRPRDGGFKYNPPNGGPADTDVTGWIQDRANELLRDGNADVKRVPLRRGAARPPPRTQHDFVTPYVDDLAERHRHGGDPRAPASSIGVDPLGGAARALLGSRSPSATASTSPWSTRRSIRRFALHDASITTARSAWTARSPYAMAEPGRAQGPLRRRLRQRPRRRPPRHRHARRRA